MASKRTLADCIRREIAARKLTGYRVAKETGIGETTVGRFLKGENDLTLENASKVLDYLGATVQFPAATTKRKG